MTKNSEYVHKIESMLIDKKNLIFFQQYKITIKQPPYVIKIGKQTHQCIVNLSHIDHLNVCKEAYPGRCSEYFSHKLVLSSTAVYH